MSKGLLIVTGGSRGIGAASCLRAAADGWDVAVNYATNRDAADAVVAGVEAKGRRALAIPGDISKEEDVLALFKTAEDALGPVKGLINSAGTTGKVTRVEDMSTEAMKGVLDLNVLGTMMCCREAVKSMSTKHGGTGGAIVNLSSIAPAWALRTSSCTTRPRRGDRRLDLGLAREVAGEGIQVNAVAPGMIDTEIHASAGAPDRVSRFGPVTPIGRAGTAEEVAEAVVWLCRMRPAIASGRYSKSRADAEPDVQARPPGTV